MRVLRVFAAAALAACGTSERSGGRPWHGAPPELTVAVAGAAESLVVLDTARSAPAPEVRFSALVQADPNHVTAVTAPAIGVLVKVAPVLDARPGDTLAAVRPDSPPGRRLVAVTSPLDGRWQPRRHEGQLVWREDTLGLIERHGYWWAVGMVADVEAVAIHTGDPALVGEAENPRRYGPGRVEWVERPLGGARYSAGLAVEFRASPSVVTRGAAVEVLVTPSHPGDSLAAVPASAIVQLPRGAAAFVRISPGLYRVRWVAAAPLDEKTILVRDGIEPGEVVAVRGLGALMAAARDSLERSAAKPGRTGGAR